MIAAISVHVRYDTKDERGQTRRERNDDFGTVSPTFTVAYYARYLWDWYFDLSDRLRRVHDGACGPIPPSEYVAWLKATGHIVYPSEYAILCAMDVAYVRELNSELADYRERQKTAQPTPPPPRRHGRR